MRNGCIYFHDLPNLILHSCSPCGFEIPGLPTHPLVVVWVLGNREMLLVPVMGTKLVIAAVAVEVVTRVIVGTDTEVMVMR